MNETILEISKSGLYIHSYRGFVLIEENQKEIGRIPLDDVSILLLSGRGNCISTNILNILLQKNIAIILCDTKYCPSGILQPLNPHNIYKERLEMQISASLPFKKRLWQTIIKQKIFNQAQCLKYFNMEYKGLEEMAKKVSSGDKENLEGNAARRYWITLFGKEFKRDRNIKGINTLLNYGYIVLRGAVARAVCCSGLCLALGLKHSNSSNSFCLVDDLIEPFRPCVDIIVKKLILSGKTELNSETKKELAKVIALDIQKKDEISTLSNCLIRLSQTLVNSFKNNKVKLEFPLSILPVI